jgi:8-oxo-dGTP diphosphatase
VARGDASEARFLERYRPGDYARPSVAVDLVVFTVLDGALQVLLVRRGEPPFEGAWALPGGFLRVGEGREEQGEDLEEAASRELQEETGLENGAVYLAQLGAFGKAGRDPRMRVISVAYYALVPPDLAGEVRAGGDAAQAGFRRVSEASKWELAFDHAEILSRALERLREEIDRSDVAWALVPASFSIAELRAVHEAVKGVSQDPGNFRRRFHRLLDDGVIEAAPGKRITVSKPAAVYRFARRGEVRARE